jgi:hypothetical protein
MFFPLRPTQELGGNISLIINIEPEWEQGTQKPIPRGWMRRNGFKRVFRYLVGAGFHAENSVISHEYNVFRRNSRRGAKNRTFFSHGSMDKMGLIVMVCSEAPVRDNDPWTRLGLV